MQREALRATPLDESGVDRLNDIFDSAQLNDPAHFFRTLLPFFTADAGVLGKLSKYNGFLIRGDRSVDAEAPFHAHGPELDWGDPQQMPGGEQVYIRIWPKSTVQHLILRTDDDYPNHVELALRRTQPGTSTASVAVAVLWRKGALSRDGNVSADILTCGARVATRAVCVLPVVLFQDHEPHIRSPPTPDYRSPYLTLSQSFCNQLISHTLTVNFPERMPHSGVVQHRKKSYSGRLPGYVAGEMIGVRVPQLPACIEEEGAESVWRSMNSVTTKRLTDALKHEENDARLLALFLMDEAYGIAESLTLEGIVGLRDEMVLSDALPDRLVVPSGMPLVLLTAIRVACYPKAFHLDAPTAVDELANRSFCALFESSWPSTTTHGRSIHVIDLVVKSAVKEAEKRIRAHLLAQEGSAKATAEVTHQILLKHLRFFQRVGQQALNAILGPSLLLTGRTEPAKGEVFGDARRAFDPFLSAMAQHARRTASGTAVPPPRSDRLPVSFYADGSHTSRLNRLVEICNSVERWLRSGEFLGRQIVKPNPLQTTPEEDASLLGLSEEELFLAVQSGTQKVCQQMAAEGRDEEEIQKAAVLGMGLGLKESLKDLKKTRATRPPKKSDAPCAAACEEATHVLTRALQEPMLFLCQPVQFTNGAQTTLDSTEAFLCTKFAQQTCADCDAPVHVLAAVFCASSTSSCPHCFRARCPEHTHAAQQATDRGVPPLSCRRCAT
tara:strand:- start:730 stop:2904 length:2175 start_codon:yes stop_codon:yes gene_type:complete